ncbi:ABC transporter substrate-binding protein [Kocuria nitroreducens]|uniref:ABC transporter substrate-binding protein n=1 Tax=Kocuria nitroreducens TaxID=3058914 RepID=UPI0036DCB352
MKSRFHGAATLSVLAVSALALSACTSTGGGEEAAEGEVSLISPGTLTVCSDIPYAPFEYVENGETVGFDIDLVNGIAEDLGVGTNVITTGFEAIETGSALDTDQCDLAASGMTINEERESVMDFSEPYVADNLGLLVAPGSGIESVADIEGRRVGAQQATTGEAFARDNGADIVQYEDSALMIQGLSTGDVQAVVANVSVTIPAIEDNPELELVEEIETGEQLGLAVKTGNTALLERVDESLAAMKEDGTIAELEAKWLSTTDSEGTGDSASPEPAAS